MDKSLRIVWIAWQQQRRNRSMALGIGAEPVELDYAGGRLNRYCRALFATLRFLVSRKPAAVVVMNPAVPLNLLMLLLRPLMGFVMVSDAHFGGVHPVNNRDWLQKILNFINARADLVIVTNNNHARYVESLGGTAFICQDPLPDVPHLEPPTGMEMERAVFLVCDFAVDEPYEQVFAAFSTLRQQGFHLYVSGNYKKKDLDPGQFPGVTLLGYVDDRTYWRYMGNCAVIVDLTEWDDCLVCGAYEALALGQVLVLSDTPALRDYFGDGALYTTHEPATIAATIEKAHSAAERQRSRARQWRDTNALYMKENLRHLRKTILAKVAAKGKE